MQSLIRTNTVLLVIGSVVTGVSCLGGRSCEAEALEPQPASALKVMIANQPVVLQKDTRYTGEHRIRPTGGPCYVVRAGGFGDGGRIYTDRDYVLAGVPEKYRGLTYVQTSQDDKAAGRIIVKKGGDPRLHVIETVVREQGIDLGGKQDVKIDGITVVNTLSEVP